MDKLVEIYRNVDNLCRIFFTAREKTLTESGKKERQRQIRMTKAEILTIITLLHRSNYRGDASNAVKHSEILT